MLGLLVISFVIVFVFVCVFVIAITGRQWIVLVRSFRNMYGYMGLWSIYRVVQLIQFFLAHGRRGGWNEGVLRADLKTVLIHFNCVGWANSPPWVIADFWSIYIKHLQAIDLTTIMPHDNTSVLTFNICTRQSENSFVWWMNEWVQQKHCVSKKLARRKELGIGEHF